MLTFSLHLKNLFMFNKHKDRSPGSSCRSRIALYGYPQNDADQYGSYTPEISVADPGPEPDPVGSGPF
jgi:hypothetical protein